MKLAISGKGGVGKTTLSSLLAGVYAAEGTTVLAVDANPDANLAAALGIPAEDVKKIVPISEMSDLIEERTGAKPGTSSPFFKLNPTVDDIPDRYCINLGRIKLLVMGNLKHGDSGCICPESVLLRSIISELLLSRSEVVIMDMDAGVEHLYRGTARAVDAFIIVVEPGQRSLQTARSIRSLASDLGIARCLVVGSKIRDDAGRQFIIDNMPDFEILGFISYDPTVADADLQGVGVFDAAPAAAAEVRRIRDALESVICK
ncbi:MAG: AAA family ATPase [Chloroflexota bacterium]